MCNLIVCVYVYPLCALYAHSYTCYTVCKHIHIPPHMHTLTHTIHMFIYTTYHTYIQRIESFKARMKKLTSDRVSINTIYDEVGRLEEETNKYATKSKDLTAKQATTAKLQVYSIHCVYHTHSYLYHIIYCPSILYYTMLYTSHCCILASIQYSFMYIYYTTLFHKMDHNFDHNSDLYVHV